MGKYTKLFLRGESDMEQQLLLFDVIKPEVMEPIAEEMIEVTEPEPIIEESVEVIEDDPIVEDSNVLGNLLTKFDAIDLAGEQRISAEELEFCQLQETVFNETVSVLKKAELEFSTLYEKYKDECKDICSHSGANFLSRYKDLDFCSDRLKNIYDAFVSRITYYFAKRYNVTLSSSDIQQKYDVDTISFSIILDEIFEQLGGLTFKEKAVDEIKAASKNAVYRKADITISKNKLAIADYVWWDTSWDNSLNISYSDRKVRPLMLALSHFISGEVSMSYGLQNIYNQLNRGSKDYGIFSKYELPNNVLQALKFYKNGKVELFFADNAKAEEFKKQYLV